MTDNNTALRASVTALKVQQAKIKERQKHELDEELEPWKADVGDSIKVVRSASNASIQTVAGILGVQNRTFIYDMLRASDARGKAPEQKTTPPTSETEIETEPEYTIEYGDGTARVTFPDDEWYDLPIIDGAPDIPEEWGEHTRARRDLYKQIVAEIKTHKD